jgi:hypothetical protein
MARYSEKARRVGLVVALAFCVGALSVSSSFAFSPEAQQMCTGDAFRLCSAEIPDIPRITACMRKHRASLSAGCRQVMDRDDAAAKKASVAVAQ